MVVDAWWWWTLVGHIVYRTLVAWASIVRLIRQACRVLAWPEALPGSTAAQVEDEDTFGSV